MAKSYNRVVDKLHPKENIVPRPNIFEDKRQKNYLRMKQKGSMKTNQGRQYILSI